MSISVSQIAQMVAFMMAQRGKPYSEQNPGRTGPNFFDCSGLIYAAAHSVGINIPRSEAIANLEAEWFNQNGATAIHSASQVKTGDMVFFTGASPDPSPFGGIGHVGMAINSTQYISAYDTAEGIVVKPISGDNFVVAMRLNGANVPAGGSGTNPAGLANGIGSGILGGLIGIPSQITDFFDAAAKFVKAIEWLIVPSHWIRIAAFLVGVALLLVAIRAFLLAAEGQSPLKAPDIMVMPV